MATQGGDRSKGHRGPEREDRRDGREVRLGEIGRSTPQFGQLRRQRVDHRAGCGARGHILARLEHGQCVGDAVGEPTCGDAIEERLALGVRRRPGVERLLPLRLDAGGAL